MPNLEELIVEWRRTMVAAAKVSHETLDELENHLRENVDQLVRSGMTEPEAFQRAVTQLGAARRIGSEFQKLDQCPWLPVKIISGIGVLLPLALTILLIARFDPGRSGFLLASHVFLVTVGYTATFLVGALGICFVAQRVVFNAAFFLLGLAPAGWLRLRKVP